MARFDQLDALVNCAGTIFRDGAEYDIDTFQRVIDVNLTGTMRMCVASRPKLAAARGTIVNTASMLSFFGGPLVPAYTASKGGVMQLTKSLAVAWAPEGIRVERHCSRLDCDRDDARPRRGQDALRPDPRAYAAEAVGRSG